MGFFDRARKMPRARSAMTSPSSCASAIGRWGTNYRIDWGQAPHYGIPTPTRQQIQDAVAPGLLTDSPAARPRGLEGAERMRDAGEVSEADFQTMKANILRPGRPDDRQRVAVIWTRWLADRR